MFDCSLSELAVILVVSVLVLKPEDLPGMVKACKGVRQQIAHFKQQVTDSIANVGGLQELKEEYYTIEQELKTITDLNGNPQQAYDIEAIQREIQKVMGTMSQPLSGDHSSSTKG